MQGPLHNQSSVARKRIWTVHWLHSQSDCLLVRSILRTSSHHQLPATSWTSSTNTHMPGTTNNLCASLHPITQPEAGCTAEQGPWRGCQSRDVPL